LVNSRGNQSKKGTYSEPQSLEALKMNQPQSKLADLQNMGDSGDDLLTTGLLEYHSNNLAT
jgi:hypothetical protein